MNKVINIAKQIMIEADSIGLNGIHNWKDTCWTLRANGIDRHLSEDMSLLSDVPVCDLEDRGLFVSVSPYYKNLRFFWLDRKSRDEQIQIWRGEK